MSTKQDFINGLFSDVTKSILSGDNQKNEIQNQIAELVRQEAQKIVPNIAERSSRVVGSIYDPDSGYSFEALQSGGVSASNVYGTPIMNADGYNAIMYPNKRDPEALKLSQKVKTQDRDWEEDYYTPDYLAKYQNQKAEQLRLLLSDEVNNPIKHALKTNMPVNVIMRTNPLAAALITSKDFVTLQVNNNLVDTLGLATLQYNLVDAFARVSAPNLVAKYWSFGPDIEIEGNVPEGKIIETTKMEMEEIKYQIGKNVGGVGATWESQLMVTQGDPYGLITGKIGTKLAQKRNEQIATIIETAGTTAGADMGALTGDRSTNDPTDFIQPVLNGIQNDVSQYAFPAQQGDVFISGSKAFQKFLTNTFTKGIFSANGTIILDNQTANGIPTIPTSATWRTSSLVSGTKLWVADRRVVPAIFGPSQRSEHFDNRNLSRATYYFDAFGTALVNTNGIKEITGVVT